MRNTNLRSGLVATMAVGALLLAGCSQREAPVYGPASNVSDVRFSSSGLSDPTNGYEVTFDGRTYSEGQTTFNYTVTWTPSCVECPLLRTLSQFMLELPPCAPGLDSFTPASEADFLTSPYTGIEGIEWTLGYGDDPYTESFAVTFPGDVALGVVRGSLRTGGSAVVAEIPGPCDGFAIGGNVFTDADSNSVQNGSETGIVNVTVSLEDGEGHVDQVLTDANGAYSFLKGAGTYALSIDAATPATDFNENLAAQFDASSPTSRNVTVGPDSPNNNFGFRPSVEKIIEAFDDSTLVTTGKTVKYWKKQLKAAMRPGEGDDDDDDDDDEDDDDRGSDLVTGGENAVHHHHHGHRADYNRAELLAFIHSIEELALPTPYQFTGGCEIEQAYRILKSRSHDPVQVLLRELLATEFNHVAGKGLTTEFGLQIVLITWGEGLLVDAPETDLLFTVEVPTPLATTSPIEGAGGVFKKINGATGGGGGTN